MVYFVLSVLILAAALFFPISKLIWVLSVRRLQRKRKTELTDADAQGQLARARFLAILVALVFSLLFNINLLGWPIHG